MSQSLNEILINLNLDTKVRVMELLSEHASTLFAGPSKEFVEELAAKLDPLTDNQGLKIIAATVRG